MSVHDLFFHNFYVKQLLVLKYISEVILMFIQYILTTEYKR